MLNGNGIENGKNKTKTTTITTIGLLNQPKKNNFARTAHFFVHFFAVVVAPLLSTFTVTRNNNKTRLT